MANIIHRIGIKASPVAVYKAVSTIEGVAAWWTNATSGTSEVGKDIEVRFNTPEGKEVGMMKMRVETLDQDKLVKWKFVEGPVEWIGTEVVFKLQHEGDVTIVLFAHNNWKEEIEFMAHCSMKWATFLLSLRELIETGKGRPSPHDMKIDNWN
ncbi:MAG: SRPBCC domain-containing protein [Chitinophagaceae bacterium]|nr:MAG: SRPBCC domain-containing protein [Chitinophagaceae bacterium]